MIFLAKEWKDTRSTISPIFSTGKLRHMGHFMRDIATSRLDKLFETAAVSGEELELKQTFGKFSMDVIASCAFGIDAKSFETGNKKSEFVRQASRFLELSPRDSFRMLMCAFPWPRLLTTVTGMSLLFKNGMTNFFYKTIKGTIEHRMRTGEKRNDLIDMMVDAMKDELDTSDERPEDQDQYELDAKFEHK